MPSEPPEPPPWCQAVRQWVGRSHTCGEKGLCPVATRYDKLLANFMGFVKLAAIAIWLK